MQAQRRGGELQPPAHELFGGGISAVICGYFPQCGHQEADPLRLRCLHPKIPCAVPAGLPGLRHCGQQPGKMGTGTGRHSHTVPGAAQTTAERRIQGAHLHQELPVCHEAAGCHERERIQHLRLPQSVPQKAETHHGTTRYAAPSGSRMPAGFPKAPGRRHMPGTEKDRGIGNSHSHAGACRTTGTSEPKKIPHRLHSRCLRPLPHRSPEHVPASQGTVRLPNCRRSHGRRGQEA